MTCLWGRCDGAPLQPALVTDEGGSLAMVPWQRCHGNGAMATGECQGDVGGCSRGCGGMLMEAEGPWDPPGLGHPPQAWPPSSTGGPKPWHHWGLLRGLWCSQSILGARKWEGDPGATELLRNQQHRQRAGRRSRDMGNDALGAPSSSAQARGWTHTHV